MRKMNLLKSFLLISTIILICSLGVTAEEDSYRASVEKLLILMKYELNIDEAIREMEQTMAQQLQQTNLSQEQSRIYEKYCNKIVVLFRAEITWDKMKDDLIELFMSIYTEKEIQELVAFYESPLGRKMVEKKEFIAEQFHSIIQNQFKNVAPQVGEIVKEADNEIKNTSN